MYQTIAPAAALLHGWQNFYVVVGSAAAALTGLQFVVLAFITQMRVRNSAAGIDTFSTPTIVYFSTVLLLGAILCAPWSGLASIAAIIALCGAVGTLYSLLVCRRAVSQSTYRLVAEDWIWHIALPIAAHAMLLGAGLALVWQPVRALFTIAAAALVLMFVGIHNAWDTVTYMVIQRVDLARQEGSEDPPVQPPM